MERLAYPIVLTKDKDAYLVYVPDFQIDTFGKNIADALEMARDAIGLMAMQLQDEGKKVPDPGTMEVEKEEDDILLYVDICFEEYRIKNDSRKVRKNVTIPYYLNLRAEKMGINFSRLLEDALVKKIGF